MKALQDAIILVLLLCDLRVSQFPLPVCGSNFLCNQFFHQPTGMGDCKPSSAGCPVDHSPTSKSDSCPVDHSSLPSQSTWSRFLSSGSGAQVPVALSQDRETSSIPKATDGKWVYPSEAQFFAAMARKNHNPQVSDMKTIVPIHNAVNERAWGEILKWESGRGSEACGGVKLVNFKGRPNEKSPKARWNMLLG